MKPLLLIDFDTTLFKTMDFWHDFAREFAKSCGRPEEYYLNNYNDFTAGSGRSRLIDFDAMIASINVSESKLMADLRLRLQHKDYLYDDARDLLNHLDDLRNSHDIAILTFGQQTYQQLKIDHVPEISNLQVYITQQLKNEYIKSQFSDRPGGLLVDDKPDQQLPSGWIEVHLERFAQSQLSPKKISEGVFEIYSLMDVPKIVELNSTMSQN